MIEDNKFILCPKCEKKLSPRAEKCPKCSITLKIACNICCTNIFINSKICPNCGDPSPFDPEYQQKILPDNKCPNCGVEIDSPEDICESCKEPLPEPDKKSTCKGLLAACPLCENKISRRSVSCIHCNTSTNFPCHLCNTTISIWAKECPECGEPEPFKISKASQASAKDNVKEAVIARIRDEESIKNTECQIAPNGKYKQEDSDIGFVWWGIYGWLGLTLGNLLILAKCQENLAIGFLIVAINSIFKILILANNKYAFLIDTILSFNPLSWVINGIYLKNRWNHPRVNSK